MQIRREPSFFITMTTGLHHSDLEGSISPKRCISSTFFGVSPLDVGTLGRSAPDGLCLFDPDDMLDHGGLPRAGDRLEHLAELG